MVINWSFNSSSPVFAFVWVWSSILFPRHCQSSVVVGVSPLSWPGHCLSIAQHACHCHWFGSGSRLSRPRHWSLSALIGPLTGFRSGSSVSSSLSRLPPLVHGQFVCCHFVFHYWLLAQLVTTPGQVHQSISSIPRPVSVIVIVIANSHGHFFLPLSLVFVLHGCSLSVAGLLSSGHCPGLPSPSVSSSRFTTGFH